MNVSNFMTTDIITLNEHDDLDLAQSEMTWAQIRHIPVLNHGRLVGILTQRDLLKAMCSVFADIDEKDQKEIFQTLSVGEIMSRNVKAIEPDCSVSQAAQTLLGSKIGCLPVVEDGNRVIGIITEADFVELASKLLEQQAEDNLMDRGIDVDGNVHVHEIAILKEDDLIMDQNGEEED